MRKTLEDFNFKKYQSYGIDEIKKYIDSFSDEWFINTSRQDNYYVHKDTNSYFVFSYISPQTLLSPSLFNCLKDLVRM